jgi:hypothetical protein
MTAPNRRSVTAGDVIHRVALHAYDLGFGSRSTGRGTLAGYEPVAMVGTGQVCRFGDRDMQARTAFTGLFEIAARHYQ